MYLRENLRDPWVFNSNSIKHKGHKGPHKGHKGDFISYILRVK